jgi:predicted MPP superfamily phosphohydrolase
MMMTRMMTVINSLFLIDTKQNFTSPLLVAGLLAIDFYVLNGIKGLSKKWQFLNRKPFVISYWVFSFLLIADILFVIFSKVEFGIRLILLVLFFLVLLFKVSFVLFILIDDLRRAILYYINRRKKKSPGKDTVQSHQFDIPRSEFLMKAGLLAGAIPLAALKLNMRSGLYDYHIKHCTLYLPHLPKAFDGIKIGQFSDLHTGNFDNKKAVLGGVEMLMREKADLIFFTGDLVDSQSREMINYQDVFSKIKAPLGVYSCTGNHDYGDYSWWPDIAAKKKNLDDLIAVHKNMGWNLLMNENRRLKINGEEIGILGVENWGELVWVPKRGKMDLTVKNTDDLPIKLLLSHDPSHWRAQILPQYPQIDVMFSGHTHGMQLGVQTNHFQWSPIEYIYKEWAGLYNEGKQQLYVNVGYGSFEVQGRVGILPEITIFELKATTNPLIKA